MWWPFKRTKQGPCVKEFVHHKLWKDCQDVMTGETACSFKCGCGGCYNASFFGQWDVSHGVFPWK